MQGWQQMPHSTIQSNRLRGRTAIVLRQHAWQLAPSQLAEKLKRVHVNQSLHVWSVRGEKGVTLGVVPPEVGGRAVKAPLRVPYPFGVRGGGAIGVVTAGRLGLSICWRTWP